jgi:hypothetical protein
VLMNVPPLHVSPPEVAAIQRPGITALDGDRMTYCISETVPS